MAGSTQRNVGLYVGQVGMQLDDYTSEKATSIMWVKLF